MWREKILVRPQFIISFYFYFYTHTRDRWSICKLQLHGCFSAKFVIKFLIELRTCTYHTSTGSLAWPDWPCETILLVSAFTHEHTTHANTVHYLGFALDNDLSQTARFMYIPLCLLFLLPARLLALSQA